MSKQGDDNSVLNLYLDSADGLENYRYCYYKLFFLCCDLLKYPPCKRLISVNDVKGITSVSLLQVYRIQFNGFKEFNSEDYVVQFELSCVFADHSHHVLFRDHAPPTVLRCCHRAL